MYGDLILRLREAAKMSEALAVLLPHSEGNATAKLYNEAADAIEELTAADVRPVVRGKWLNDFCGKGRFSKRIVQCSLCGNFLDLDGVNAGRGDANYCPNCGADMREPPKEET